MHWIFLPTPSQASIKALHADIFGPDTAVAKWHNAFLLLLLQRGIGSAAQASAFLNPQLSHLHSPFLMKDMHKAVNRIITAMETNEHILIYGDYDVDGSCAVALMYLFLKRIYSQVAYYVPDRYIEGYGVSEQGIAYAAKEGFSLIITLDCGIKSSDRVQQAKEHGIDVIVCDHHLPDNNNLPKAHAILNPKQNDCPYPFKELCGCGVGFKLAWAISETLKLPSESYLCYLDLVAVATAADIVPVVGENRVLITAGLALLNEQQAVGCASPIGLLLSGASKPPFTMTDLVFVAAPRINAAGRMQHASEVVNLLISEEIFPAEELRMRQKALATHIETLNKHRKQTDEQITQEALSQIEVLHEENRYTTVVFKNDWHKGVIGIVASRLIETYYRPTVVFTQSGGVYAASARSVGGFNLYEALEACSSYLVQYGGHRAAAGMTLLPEQYEGFKAKFEAVVREQILPSQQENTVRIDGLLSFGIITNVFVKNLERLAPFGPENPTPVFVSENIFIKDARKIGKDKSHLKMTLYCPLANKNFQAVGFKMGILQAELNPNQPYKIAYSIEQNTWNGSTYIQLRIRDIRSE